MSRNLIVVLALLVLIALRPTTAFAASSDTLQDVPAASNEPSFDVKDTPSLVDSELPKTFRVSQNYPNPFNLSTTIEYDLPHESEITIKIYNVLQEPVKKLVDREQQAGKYRIHWDGKDDSAEPLPSGVYFSVTTVNNHNFVRKLVLVK